MESCDILLYVNRRGSMKMKTIYLDRIVREKDRVFTLQFVDGKIEFPMLKFYRLGDSLQDMVDSCINMRSKDGKYYYIGIEDIEISVDNIEKFENLVTVLGYKKDKEGRIKYKVVYQGEISYTDEEYIRSDIEKGNILNVRVNEAGELEFAEYVEDLSNREGFEEEIEKQLKVFQAKAKMLDIQWNFDIRIEKNEVTLMKIKGEGGKGVIVPSFIDMVRYNAFFGIAGVVTSLEIADGVYLDGVILPNITEKGKEYPRI